MSDFTAGAGGDIFDWDTTLSNNTTTTIGAAAADLTTAAYLGTTISNTVITGGATTLGIFEFMGASLGAGNDIIVGTTTSATIEGWAATALATVAHTATDNMLFVMYDSGGVTSTAAIFEFTANATTSGIDATELQLVAVADVTQDALTFDNFI